jgi:hypothetical protein
MLLTSLHWLMSKSVIRPCGSCLTLIRNHVTQSLIVNKTYKDVNLHLISEYSRIHSLISIIVIAIFQKLRAKVLDHIIILVFLKGFGCLESTLQRTIFSS